MSFRVALALLLASTLAQAAAPAGSIDPADVLPTPPHRTTGDVSLAEPIAPVPHGLDRWSLGFTTVAGVADPFYNKVATWLLARRGFGSFAAEVFGGPSFSWAGPALDLCTQANACISPSGQRLAATPGRLDWVGGIGGVWRAAQGKLSVAGLAPSNFSLEFSLAAAGVGYTIDDNGPRSMFSPGGRLGLGLGAELTETFGVRFDVQALFYPAQVRGESELQRQMFLGGTIAWRPGGGP